MAEAASAASARDTVARGLSVAPLRPARHTTSASSPGIASTSASPASVALAHDAPWPRRQAESGLSRADWNPIATAVIDGGLVQPAPAPAAG